jgi:hypothetical protein
MHNHSRIVTVILAHERRQFEIGDAILEELGPPQVEYHDGSYERLGEIVAELAELMHWTITQALCGAPYP